METMVKFGTPEPILYKDPDTAVSVSVRALGNAEVYTTAVTEGQTRDVIDSNVKQAAVLGLIKFFDNMSRDLVAYSSIQGYLKDARKCITEAIQNAGYGVEMVDIHSIRCDEESQKAMDSKKRNIYTEAFPPQPTIFSMTDGKSPQTGGRFCPNCGSPTGGAKFCTNCGTKLI